MPIYPSTGALQIGQACEGQHDTDRSSHDLREDIDACPMDVALMPSVALTHLELKHCPGAVPHSAEHRFADDSDFAAEAGHSAGVDRIVMPAGLSDAGLWSHFPAVDAAGEAPGCCWAVGYCCYCRLHRSDLQLGPVQEQVVGVQASAG